MKAMRQATIRDVAREAEVSVASVSRALNGHHNVHSDMRARVLEVADRLGYVPHAGARSLSTARTHAVGVVLPDLHGEFFSEIVRGMNREASAQGLQLLMSNFHASADQAKEALRAMRGRVDGLVVMAPHFDTQQLLGGLPAALPRVMINCRSPTPGHPLFRVDNARGVQAMVAHLRASGRHRIAHLAGPEGNMDADERRAAFVAAVGADALVLQGDFSEEAGAAAARELLARNMPVDAIFAANDMMAIGCLLTLREEGVDVPGTVAVAGFDDIPVARYMALTTMRVRIAEIGAQALAQLATIIQGAPAEERVVMHAPDLVVRATSAR